MKDYKVVVLGVGGVGKSALSVQYVHSIFLEKYDPTIEDSYKKQVELDGELCHVDVLDTAGTEQFAAVRDMYIQEGDGFALVYSITSRHSFRELEEIYKQIVRVKQTSNFPVLLVGNKVDLRDVTDLHQVTHEECLQRANEWSMDFMETSAKDKQSVNALFYCLLCQIRQRKDLHVLMDKKGRKKWLVHLKASFRTWTDKFRCSLM